MLTRVTEIGIGRRCVFMARAMPMRSEPIRRTVPRVPCDQETSLSEMSMKSASVDTEAEAAAEKRTQRTRSVTAWGETACTRE